jgi:hypothetical protein
VNFPKRIKHRKGLATKAEGRNGFTVKPAKAAKNVISRPAVSRRDAH